MINFLKNSISLFILLVLLPKVNSAQCVTTTINAQAGTGPSTTICSGQCANLTATIQPPPNSTTTYSVGSTTYSTMPYAGGNNVFASSADDLWSDSISIGFNFCYFGNTYNKLLVGSNGEITFDLSLANSPEQWITNQVLPNLVEHPGNTICGAYRDYDPLPGGVVRTYTAGVAPCRQFVVYWSGVTLFSCSTPVSSFQIILYESTNQIAVNIQNSTACPSWNNGRGLIGIQNGAGTVAYGPATRNTLTSWTAINESWRFVPTAAPSFSVNWAGPGGFTATGLTATPCPTTSGTYSATISYCGGSKTSTVNVNVSTPTINVSSSSNTVCPPGSVTLTATGATTYTWMPGSLTGSAVVVSPTINTTYTVIGTAGTCTSSATRTITVGTAPTINAFNLTGTVCPGNSANCIATGALSYTWNPGNITGNIVSLSPTVSTIYTITGTAGGCPGTTTLLVGVGTSPTITASSSPTSICVGSTATLSAIGATSYTWNPGTLTGTSVTVSPTSTTIYTVTGTSALFACPGTRTISLTVNTTPTLTAVSNPTAICIGSSATLTSTGATTYTWMPGSLSGGTVTVAPVITTIYTVTGSNGTCSSTRTVQTIVNTPPTVTAAISSSTVCSGSSVTLTAGGATTYTWNPGSLTGGTVVATPTANTTYTVIGSTGTCTNSANVSVTVNPTPTLTAVANPTAICSGAGTTVTLTSTGATSYTWMPGSLSGGTVTVTPTITTTYTVTGASAAGCRNTRTVTLTVNTTPTVTANASSPAVCSGNTVTLTSTGATSYTWMPGSLIGGTVTATPTITTTYTVTGANGSCTGTRTVLVVVIPSPTVSATANPTSICSGSSATLTGTGATTYTWMPGSLSGGTVVVSPTISTTYTLTGSSGVCSKTTAITLTVNPSPTITAIANPTAICVGSSATLTSSGATSYTWMPGSLPGGTVTVSPTITTVYTVTGANGSCTNTRTVSLTVNSSPTITAVTNPTAICSGQSATLTGTGAITYTWMPGSIFTATTVVSPTITTTYTLTGANASGCRSTRTVNLVVNPSPTLTAVANPTVICIGASATLSSTGATSYTWMPGSLTGGTVAVTPTITTIYTVTGSNGTCSNTRTVSLTVNPTPTITATVSSPSICSGSSATLTSTGASTYTWMPGSLSGGTVIVSPTITTTYTVTGSTASGCTNTRTVTLVVTPGPTLVATASPTSICSGSSSTLTASGATTYTWMPGSITTATTVVTPTTTTIYTVTGNNGTCSGTMAVTVSVTPLPTVTAVSNPTAVCSGSSATLTGSGATSYTWMPGSLTGGTVTITPTITTTYTLTGVNGSCSGTTTVSVVVNSSPTVVATATPTSQTICSGRTATLSASGAVTYTWMPGSMVAPNVLVSPPTTTTYTLSGTNASGCTGTTVITITVNPSPTISVLALPSLSICAGQTATLTATGATSTYSWLPGPVLGNPLLVSPASTQIYTVAGANAFGCRSVTTVTLTVNTNPTVTASASSSTICAGNSVTLTSSGATSYTWMPGSLTGGTVTASPTITTTYTVTGANGNCTNTNTVLVTVNPAPTVTAVSSPTAICSGNSATLTANGATTYTWMPGSLTGTNAIVSPTITTTYTVTGNNGICSNTATVTLSVTTTPTVTAVSNPTGICVGSSATLTAGGGAASYAWLPGLATGTTIVVSPTVTTTYTVTGANGVCTGTQTVLLTVSPLPTVTAVSNPTSMCAGSSATLTGSGANTYTWMPGSLTGTSVVVSPTLTTTYTVTGSNAGCNNTATVGITVFTAPSITALTSNTVVCVGTTATLSATGAISYTWNPGALTGSSVAVTPTSTTVYTVTGTNGICSSNATVSILVNTYPTVTAVSNPTALCVGNSATLTASGATSYTWMPGSFTTTSVVVTPTSTTVYTITGANGNCTGTQTLNLTVNPNPTVTASSTPTSPVCAGNSYTLTASGASTYTWMPGSLTGTSVVVTPTANTVYTITGANATGCSSTRTLNVIVIPGPTVTAVANPTTICSGQTATLTASGALSYTWMPVALIGTNIIVNPTVTTTYTVTGINAGGCTATRTVQLVVNTTPTITAATTSTVLCSGSSATLTSGGATTYTWNPGSLTGGTIVVTPTTNTTYTVVGANGACTDTKTISVTVNPTPTVTASASPTILCIGGTSTLTANGATSYTWMPPAITGSQVVVSPTVITVYTVTGVNSFGCSKTSTVLVNVNTPTIVATSTPTSICVGGSATITASGASTYTWLPGPSTGTSIVVNPTVTTTYSVAGTNTFGCIGAQTITLVVAPLPTVTAASSSTAVCSGNSATLTGSGATTYTWMPGSLTGSNVVVTPTTSTVYTVTGSNGSCSNTTTISLIVNPNPTVTGVANPTIMCAGATSTLTGFGASTYTWNPGSLVAITIAVNPTTTTIYTVTGADALGCTNSNTVEVVINTPTITTVSTPTSLCIGSSATITSSGASTYTWMPGSLTGSTVVVTPTVTTTYSVTGTNTMGCQGTNTTLITVFTNPTVTAAANPTTICSGLTTTLTSSGALTYTWIPGSLLGGTVVTSPTTTTTYSVIGVNGVCPADTATVTVNVLQSPQNVTASNSGTITCLTPSVDLFGSTTSTNVTYQWSGPGTYTSSLQNPTGITTGGVYTLSVIDAVNGCITTATTAVISNTAGPVVTLTSTGTITCISNTVNISVSSTVSAVTYTWTGPSSFTSTATSFSTSVGGVYTVSAFDPASGCTSTNTVAAITDTYVAITATITPATCTGTVSNNDGSIKVAGFINPNDKYDLVAGASYTGTATYPTATVIPVSGIITNTLVNPASNTPYTIRFFGANGCTKDTTLVLIPIDCSVSNALGLAKAITTVTLNTNGTYGVTYKIVVKNSGFATLNNVVLTENLSNTFPLPTTFTVSSAPVIITPVTSLTLDPTFDGSAQPVITNTVSSSLAVGEVDTLVFTVDVLPNGIFGTFNNSLLGNAIGGASSTMVSDSSQVGLNPDPDNDNNPTNNNIPTPLNLTPKTFFGVTKEGELSQALIDGSYDITYTVSIHNLGNDTLRNIILKDSLAGTTIKAPASYSMKSGPTMLSGTLTPNSSYNGNSDPNLIVSTGSKMAPNTVNKVVFTINVMPDTVTVISNSAFGSAVGTSTIPVTDFSNDGNNPDVNGNGVWNEPSDNVPTVLVIDKFLVPEVFTPNGDGVNDFFVIKGIQKTENTLTIYNRWGNKVYKMDNYDNTWNGMPNVSGTLGNQKLPQGTYYYILEFKGETNLKTTNGFVVLQY